jgi:hypothetical protein
MLQRAEQGTSTRTMLAKNEQVGKRTSTASALRRWRDRFTRGVTLSSRKRESAVSVFAASRMGAMLEHAASLIRWAPALAADDVFAPGRLRAVSTLSLEFHDWIYMADLKLTTPLRDIESHGRVWRGAGPPEHEARCHGCWVPLNTHRTRFSQMRGIPTIFGVFAPDDPQLIAFLRAFRILVESSETVDRKVTLMGRIVEMSPLGAAVLDRVDGDLAAFWFASELSRELGLSKRLANQLYRHGFRTVEEVTNASNEDLVAVPGMGTAKAARIRALIRLKACMAASAAGQLQTTDAERQGSDRHRVPPTL